MQEYMGGKFEPFESPEDCLLREVQEETGLTLTSYRCRGVVTFLLGELTEYMFLYTADAWAGTLVKDAARNEGILEWVPKEQVEQLQKAAKKALLTHNRTMYEAYQKCGCFQTPGF